jgi:phosphomannomutase/phosphoglucomutase
MHSNIFREYDIRGVVGEHLTDETVSILGRAIGTFFVRNNARRIAIGYDARESSPRFCDLLSEGFNATGCDVVLIGKVPTPVLYHTAYTKDVDGGVMITGSHNPPDHNGFKICLGRSTLFGSQIQEIKNIALSEPPASAGGHNAMSEPPASAGGHNAMSEPPALAGGQNAMSEPPASAGGQVTGSVNSIDVLNDYCIDIASRISVGPRKLKAVVDAGNGMGGVTAVPVYEALGVELVKLFIEPDSRFPNHHPDPTVTENLEDTIRAVIESNADVGLAFDGDGDRLGVVDENGRIIWGDELMILLSRSVLESKPAATIIAEVKCSQNLFDDIEKHGGKPVMWKAGHSLIKSKMKETGAALAGEMSGHIFFADRFYGFDDAAYAGARVLEILSKSDKPLSELLADIPPTFSTPELRIDCPDEIKFDVVSEIAKHFTATHEVITIDGARIIFDHGWGLVRASNTQAILVLRFEADSSEYLNEMRGLVESKVRVLLGTR